MRDRVFLIAYHRDLGEAVQFPKATHSMAVPAGYGSTRTVVALRHVDLSRAEFRPGRQVSPATAPAR